MKEEEIILYAEIQKIGQSHYINVNKSIMDFHNMKDGSKLKLRITIVKTEE